MINKQFEFYLKLVGLQDIDKNGVQYIELRRCFYAAFGQLSLLIVKTDDLKKLIKEIWDEVKIFYDDEINKLLK